MTPRRKPRFGWGGARPGAGRKPRGSRSSAPHRRRPAVYPADTLELVAYVASDVDLRSSAVRDAVDHARQLSFERGDFELLEVTYGRDHLVLRVRAFDRDALARGMQGFQIASARRVNRLLRRTGTVFPDRYRLRSLTQRVKIRQVKAT